MATAEGVTVPPVTEAGSGAAAGVDEVTVLVDGTSGKTIGDFVRGYNFKADTSGTKYKSFVDLKWWQMYKKEKDLGDDAVCILVKTDTAGKVTGPDNDRVSMDHIHHATHATPFTPSLHHPPRAPLSVQLQSMMAFINRQFTANTCKANVVHDMARALAWFANKQLNAGNQRTIKELVVALPGVKAGLKHARKQTAKKDRDEDVDLQFGFTDALTPDQKSGLGLTGLSHAANGLLTPLSAARTAMDAMISLALGSRGEDIRNIRMTDLGTSVVSGLGRASSPNGTKCITIIVNDGKVIGGSGRRLRRFIAPHLNPALDAAASIGLSLVLRRIILGEQSPSISDLTLNFKLRLCRSQKSENVGMDYDSQRRDVMNLLTAAGEKYGYSAQQKAQYGTHFFRHDTANTLGDNNVDEKQILLMLSAPLSSLNQTYKTGAPVDAVTTMGGSISAASHSPAWMVPVPRATLEELAPFLKTQALELAELKETTGITAKDLKEARLVALENTADAQALSVQSLICMAAARPRLGGKIDANSPTIRELHKGTNKVLALPFFEGPSFSAVGALVKAAEDAEIATADLTVVPTPIQEVYEEYLGPRDQKIMGQLALVQEQQGQMNQRLTQLLQQGHQLPPTTTTTTTTAATATALAAAEETPLPQKKKERKWQPRSNNVDTSTGQVHIKELASYADASAVYGAYFEGINGGPSYQQLESEGKKWRRYKGGKDAWAKTALLGRFLAREEEKGDKEQAIAALQRLADSAGKKGNSKSPDWKEVLRRLRNTDEEKKRKTEIEEERESKKAKKAAGSGCEEE